MREGEKDAASLDYAPLPESMATALEQRLSTIKVGATP